MENLAGRRVLNTDEPFDGEARSGVVVSLDLQKAMLSMQGTFLAEDGSGVDYVGMKGSDEFLSYKTLVRELQAVDASNLGCEDERRCFFLNLYNALTVHGLVEADWGPKGATSVLDIPGFWTSTSYRIGNHVFSLDEIEHGILRANRRHPGVGGKVMFAAGDPRLALAVPLDARVHFALVCGAKSCPPIRVFQTKNLERGLLAAARNFCDQEVSVDARGRIVMSKIFDWFSQDFGETQLDVLRTISSKFMSPEGESKAALDKLLHAAPSSFCFTRVWQSWRYVVRATLKTQTMLPGPLSVTFKPYDWSLNKS